jgi:hypothetical protein
MSSAAHLHLHMHVVCARSRLFLLPFVVWSFTFYLHTCHH